jgi:hypothetical protein
MSVCLPPGLWQELVIVLLSIAIFLLFSGLDGILAYLSYLTYPSSVHVSDSAVSGSRCWWYSGCHTQNTSYLFIVHLGQL